MLFLVVKIGKILAQLAEKIDIFLLKKVIKKFIHL